MICAWLSCISLFKLNRLFTALVEVRQLHEHICLYSAGLHSSGTVTRTTYQTCTLRQARLVTTTTATVMSLKSVER